jgi:hypothetical protein
MGGGVGVVVVTEAVSIEKAGKDKKNKLAAADVYYS